MNQGLTITRQMETAMGMITVTADDAAVVMDTIGKAQASNTIRAHHSRLAAFRSWLASRGIDLIDGVAVPAPIVAMYLNDRWNAGRKLNTIGADLAAIGWWHAEQRMESPARDKAVRDTMRGLRRKTSEAIKTGQDHFTPAPADAAVGDVIRRMICAIDAHAPNESIRLRDRAMLLMGFAMGARRSELAGLRIEHIKHHMQGIIVTIWAAKTGDRESQVMYGNDPNLCPIAAVRAWMDHANIADGHLFRQITITPRGQRRAIISGSGITGQVVNRSFIRWADAAGLPSGKWTAHSMRAGFCVQGPIDGIPESELRAQTGHKSAVFYTYAQRADAFSIRRNSSL